MKSLPLNSLQFKEEVQKDFSPENPFSPSKVVRNIFTLAAQKRFPNGTNSEHQRLFFKILEKLDGDCELEDSEFNFLFDTFQVDLPLSIAIPPILDFLQEIKFKTA